MKEFLPIISSVALLIGGASAFVWGLISGFRKREKLANERMDKAQSELVDVMRLEAEAWKRRYEGEHQEYTQYRQNAHNKDQASTAKILKLTADLAELQSKTDLTPVISFQNQQNEINSKMLQTLDRVMQTLDTILQRLT